MNSPYRTSVARTGKSALSTGAAVLALTLAISGQALATPGNPQWEGAVSSEWTDGGNWWNGSPPTAGDSPVIVAPTASANSPVIDGALGEAGTLFLGSLTGANLSIINGGQLNGGNVIVGNSTNNAGMTGIADESATLSVTGPGSTLAVDFLTVGYYGDGVLNVTDGAQLLVNSVTSIAPSQGGTGTITVNGLGSRLEGGSLMIGGDGTGYFEVSGGATAETTTGAFGVNAGSAGYGTITGAGTNWAVTGAAFTVGGSGLGDLVISDGAIVSSQGRVNIGLQAGGEGSLTVTGAGSSLTAATEFFVGQNGAGQASILNGGTASGDKVILGFDAASSGMLIVDGADSLVQGTSYVMIGYSKTGVATISNGGTLKADGARGITIGFAAGSSGVLNIGAASGDTAVAAGYIDAASGIKFGDGTGRLVLNHTNSDYVLAAPLVGVGAVEVLAGTTIFTGDSSNFAGGFWIDGGKAVLAGATNAISTTVNAGGTLQIGNAAASGSLNSDILNDGTLIFAGSGATSYGGALTGAGRIIKSGSGTTTVSGISSAFAGSATVEGGTLLLTGALDGDVEILSAGTLQVGNAVTDGDLLGDVVNNGTLIFNQVADYDYTGALSGDGGLIKQGAGILLLSGDYRYTGSTVVENGLVRLSSQLDVNTDLVVDGGTFDLGGRDQEVAGLSGAGGTLSLGTGALTVVQSGNSSFGGEIAGSGGFIKDGAGSLNLTGTSSFSGQVDVNGGRLAVNGLLPGSIIVNDGGTLGGAGTAGAVIVRNGGMLAPGNSIGTLAVTGDVQFDAGSVYEVEVDAAGNSDRINATGAATINGGTVSVLAAAGTYRSTSDYVILTAAGGVTGRFGDEVDIDLPFLTPSLAYSANEVTLTLLRNERSFASVAGTPNQQAVALALDASDRNSAVHRAVAGQSDEAGAVQAFNALSGELWATAGTFMVDRTRRIGELVIGRMEQADVISHALSSAGSASRQTLGGTGIWGQATGSWNKVKGNGNASRATQSGAGFVTGIDTLLGDWRIGAAFSHNEDKVRVDSLGSEATVTGSALAAYIGGGWQNARLRIGGSYGWLDVKGKRTVAFPSLSETVAANYDGKSASAFAELSYAASFGRAQVEPFAGVNYVHLRTDGFAETAGAVGALDVARQTRDVTYTTLGLRLGTVLPVSDEAAITPRVSAAWLRGFGDLGARGRHSLSSGQSFTIEGLPATRNALRLEAGAQANILPGGSLGIAYVGNMADRWSDHGLKLGFSYSF